MNTPPISNLPKWAQRHIDALERRIQDLENALAIANDERGTGRVTVDHWRHPVTLPDDTRVRFHFDPRTWIDASEREPDCLQIMGSGALVIVPHVTNVVKIKLADR